jgi:hypothetical protein
MSKFLNDLALQGYDIEQTGGGCTTLQRRCDDDTYYWITQAEDAMAPTSMSEPVLVGFYWNNAENWRLFEFKRLTDALAWINQHPHGVERIETQVTETPILFTPGVGNDDPAYT